MRRRNAWMAAALLAATLRAWPAAAQEDAAAREEARVLLREGNALFEKQDFAGALERYRAANARLQSPKILLNIGTTLRRLGREAEAAEAYELYLRQNRPEVTAEKRAQVREVIREIDQKLGQIHVEVFSETRIVEGATVRIDGEVRGMSPLPRSVRVAPGLHRIEAEKDGYEPGTFQEVDIAAGQTPVLVVLRIKEIPPPAPEPPPSVPPPDPIVAPPSLPPPPEPTRSPPEEPVIIESAPVPEDFSHAWRPSLAARQDVLLRTDALAAFTGVGAAFGLGDYVELSLWGLRGRRFGGRATATVYAWPQRRLKPMLTLGVAGLDVDAKKVNSDETYGFEPLAHVGGGLLVEFTRLVGMSAEAAYERFFVSLDHPDIDDHLVVASLSLRVHLWE
jgi:hypothetical protein